MCGIPLKKNARERLHIYYVSVGIQVLSFLCTAHAPTCRRLPLIRQSLSSAPRLQSTLQRFGAVLSSGTFPGLDAATVRTIRSDLVKTAAAVSSE